MGGFHAWDRQIMKIKPLLVLLAATMLSVSVQAEQDHQGHGHDSEASQEASGPHEVRGIFLGFDEGEGRVTMAHEAIPDVMMAMRMHLRLPEGQALPALEPGDKVAFRMFSRIEAGRVWYASDLELLPSQTELELPPQLREAVGY
ncbi:hypothetical protein DU505_12425 [Billgrantia montanilacus]|uniref:Copper-binding protein n=2 Tax=Billgrantia montanilacus TaxID=2282305 RepID=A0A368TVV8_9GAMM|nr:hypothetical protein DU505_12425 [Halomonas montanilacus]